MGYDLVFCKKKMKICNMKSKELNAEKLVKVPQKGLLSLVADKLKDRVLFPEKVENIKHSLRKIKVVNS